jgi:hypothetical protein
MVAQIDGNALAGLELADDGSQVRIRVTDSMGMPAYLILPADCIQQLMMALPAAANQVLQLRYKDDSLRIVYPAHRLAIELCSDRRAHIVTLETPDGFRVSFGLSEAQCRQIGNAVQLADEARAKMAGRPN